MNLFPNEYKELIRLRASANNQNDKEKHENDIKQANEIIQQMTDRLNESTKTIEQLRRKIEA